MIDWTRVNELRDEVGADDFAEVVELFLEEVEEVVSRFRTAPDPASFEGELHFLKGSSLNLGFRKLGDLCAAGETMAAAGKAAEVDLAAVIEAYTASIKEFSAHLGLDQAA
jgi:HPt (histidine-containing phosphotransfer) domain-containing protein